VFTSRSSLWTDLDCEDGDQARAYLERSRSLPVNLSLDTKDRVSPHHPFSETIPHAIGRLRSLSIEGTPENLQDITAHLSHPAPLLEKLSICGGYNLGRHLNPALTPALFDGDLSSLRELCLESVRTQLPWRNMANLTSFTLCRTSPGGATVRQILDFFKSAPLLREVNFYFATPTSSDRDCKLVSLACLKRMRITGGGSASLLLDHLLIPIGADLGIEVDLPSPLYGCETPRLCPPRLGSWRGLQTLRMRTVGHFRSVGRMVGLEVQTATQVRTRSVWPEALMLTGVRFVIAW
jgi:hypothetical protein